MQMERTFDTNRTFADLGIIPPILKALEEMGFEHPTEVQGQAVPHALAGKDLIVMAKTGSGKTAVFGASMLQLTDPEAEGPQGLILTPTRELAVQVDSDIRRMARHLAHRTTAVYGQHSMDAEVKELEKGVTIVTGTPGRVYDHIQQGTLDTKHIKFLVLDEADRMLDMGFIDQVERIIRSVPRDRATMLFSATMPEEIRRICRRYMKDPETIETGSQTKTVDTIRQLYYRVNQKEKLEQLNKVLLIEQPESCMIFCNTRVAADKVGKFLTKKGYASRVLHGNIAQSRRMKTIQQFKQGKFRLLVATDVAARGIHIDELSLVINYDVPLDRDSYVHRIGRTGRAGHEGRAVSIVTRDDLMDLYAIEEHIGVLIEECEMPGDEYFEEHRQEIDEWIAANRSRKPGTAKRPEPARAPGGQQESRESAASEAGSPGRQDRERPDRRRKKGSKAGRKGQQGRYTGQGRPSDGGRQKQGDGRHKQHGGAGKPPQQDGQPFRRDANMQDSGKHGAMQVQKDPAAQGSRKAHETRTGSRGYGAGSRMPGTGSRKPGTETLKPGAEERRPGENAGFFRRIFGRILGK